MKKVSFRIKIINCLSNLSWYHGKIGKVYTIASEGYMHYYFKSKAGGIKGILKSDCKKLKP